MRVMLSMAMAALMLSSAAAAANEPRSAGAVVAADEAWLQAKVRGDADALDALLMPNYRSIGADGKATTKAKLINSARKRGADPKLAVAVREWKAAHPSHAEVTLAGDTVILRWTLEGAQAGKVSSSDIFVYVDGRWRAVYSQHSTASQ